VLSPAEIAERLPGNTEPWIGGLHTPSDGRAEPSMAVPALAIARAIAASPSTRIARPVVSRPRATGEFGRHREGDHSARSRFCLAGGAWSSLFCRRHGVDLPVGLVNATACRTTPAPEITSGALGTDHYCIRRRLDGGF